MDVSAVERFGHEPQYPVTNNWPHLVQQLVGLCAGPGANALAARVSGGHSLGRILERHGCRATPNWHGVWC